MKIKLIIALLIAALPISLKVSAQAAGSTFTNPIPLKMGAEKINGTEPYTFYVLELANPMKLNVYFDAGAPGMGQELASIDIVKRTGEPLDWKIISNGTTAGYPFKDPASGNTIAPSGTYTFKVTCPLGKAHRLRVSAN